MEESEKIYLATKCAEKNYTYETLLYGDDLYSYDSEVRSEIAEEVWEYVEEYKDIGRVAFRAKYKEGRFY